MFISGFRQLNLTIRQSQNDLRNQVTQIQEKIANTSVAGNRNCSSYHDINNCTVTNYSCVDTFIQVPFRIQPTHASR